ncbi:MAG: long-chain-acyl-CoA synthetase [Terracidiphilus sp.]
MSALETMFPANVSDSPAKAWLRALELTAAISRNRSRVLSDVIDDLASGWGDTPALLSDRESFTYRSLSERSNQYARWALEQGLQKGEVVGLLMTNRPEYFAIWLGISSVGGVVALLNTNLIGRSLSHCIDTAVPKHLIVAEELLDSFHSASPYLSASAALWVHGCDHGGFRRIDQEVQRHPGGSLAPGERSTLSIEDRALYIFTSGTTGWPKAANVSHARVLQWAYWFAGLMDAQPTDRMYNCLPMYHSIGGVLVPGALLVAGGSVVIREKFSASQFWRDVVSYDCTMFQYIGEFCRYMLHAEPAPPPLRHRIRLACGNGLAADIWNEFKERFSIPRIFEFYASTEGGVSLFNVEGKAGAIGRIPAYLEHRFPVALAQFDVESGEPIRNKDGFCVRSAPNEVGEAIGRVSTDPGQVGSRFEGYTDEGASDKKILRHVFQPNDMWIRTGDLMRKDEKGFYYFVDRIGDTFRWKGENVAASEVSHAICAFPGVRHASVYGVAIPLAQGRAGMAAIVADREIDLHAFRRHLASCLPSYARPLFLRFRNEIDLTGTFKYSKTELVRQGFDPKTTADEIYLDSSEMQRYLRLDEELYERIQSGQVRA